jgi:hypothetical protein
MTGRALKVASAAVLLLAATSGTAETRRYHVRLDGASMLTPTGSSATGTAKVVVDTERQRVSVDLRINGIATDDLWKTLVAKPIGPVHFHKYGSHVHHADDVVLILPLPYGPTYHPTAHGFRVVMKDYDYAAGAKLLGSLAPFADFVSAMDEGKVVLNVHTETFHDGEIAGLVVAG